jgi:hypothetical protein
MKLTCAAVQTNPRAYYTWDHPFFRLLPWVSLLDRSKVS